MELQVAELAGLTHCAPQPDPFPESCSLRKKMKASSLRDLSQEHTHTSLIPLLPPLPLPSFVQGSNPEVRGCQSAS